MTSSETVISMTTENSNTVIQTGSCYISESMMDTVEISTANMWFSTMMTYFWAITTRTTGNGCRKWKYLYHLNYDWAFQPRRAHDCRHFPVGSRYEITRCLP